MKPLIDFHSHILPGIDDGSRTVEESIAMLQMESEQNVGCVVATPHFYARQDQLARFIDLRMQAQERLDAVAKKLPGIPEIIAGAEVHYFQGMCDCDELSKLTIGRGSYILIEMPFPPWTEEMYHQLEMIYQQRNLKPIIAHVDRYIKPFRTFKIPQRLSQMPVLIQANAEFFLRRSTSSFALRMLQKGGVHLLGSDCHNLTDRKPNLSGAAERIEKRLGAAAIEQINRHSQTVLCSNPSVIHTRV